MLGTGALIFFGRLELGQCRGRPRLGSLTRASESAAGRAGARRQAVDRLVFCLGSARCKRPTLASRIALIKDRLAGFVPKKPKSARQVPPSTKLLWANRRSLVLRAIDYRPLCAQGPPLDVNDFWHCCFSEKQGTARDQIGSGDHDFALVFTPRLDLGGVVSKNQWRGCCGTQTLLKKGGCKLPAGRRLAPKGTPHGGGGTPTFGAPGGAADFFLGGPGRGFVFFSFWGKKPKTLGRAWWP